MTDDTAPPPIGWLRAALTAALIAFVAIALLVYGTNAVLTNVHGKTRSSLVGVATTMFFVVLIGLAWALRQLQRRKII
jgi:TRAP-type C4-dicarboxylate transport system permease small subunit